MASLNSSKKRELRRCAMCDAWYYADDFEEVQIHRHPEDQSGSLRDAWLKSGLSYEDWIKTTREGQARERLIRPLDKVKKGQAEQEQVKEIVFNKGSSENSAWMKAGPVRGVNKEEEREPENL